MPTKMPLFTWEQEPVSERGQKRCSRVDRGSNHPLDNGLTGKADNIRQPVPLLKRDPPGPLDSTLSAFAVGWAAALPSSIFPKELCERFPRLVNRLALCWPDRALAVQFLDSLLKDKRGGRKGFPPDVAVELRQLQRDATAQIALAACDKI